jgi:hypothetical protein
LVIELMNVVGWIGPERKLHVEEWKIGDGRRKRLITNGLSQTDGFGLRLTPGVI